MDLFTGKKLAELRKLNSLSQENLAEKMNVSRQAVSKWERGEASPDMDNLMMLARIYDITVDDILGDKKAVEIMAAKAESKAHAFGGEAKSADPAQNFSDSVSSAEETKENISGGVITAEKTEENISGGVSSAEKTEENISGGVITAEKTEENISGDRETYENKKEKTFKKKQKKDKGERYRPQTAKKLLRFPYPVVVIIVYLVLSLKAGVWHPAWLMFFTIPIYYQFAFSFNAYSKRRFLLRQPVILTAILLYLIGGFVFAVWHPTWLLFLALPFYFWFVSGYAEKKKQ